MNNINSNYTINQSYLLNFKQQKAVNNSTVSNPVNSSVSMNGMDALASYNTNLVHKNDNFKIPTLTMIPIPENIEDVEGEKQYSPNGELVCVVKDEGQYKTIYQNDEHKSIKVIDKNTNKIIKQQGCYVANTKEVRVYTDPDDAVGYFTDYDEKNGEMVPIGNGKHIYYPNDTKKEFIQWFNNNEYQYQIIERSNVSKDAYSCDRVTNYDKNGNIVSIETYNE